MQNKLTKLYNTLATIETRGESTKTMAVCLQYVEQLIREEAEAATATAESEVS